MRNELLSADRPSACNCCASFIWVSVGGILFSVTMVVSVHVNDVVVCSVTGFLPVFQFPLSCYDTHSALALLAPFSASFCLTDAHTNTSIHLHFPFYFLSVTFSPRGFLPRIHCLEVKRSRAAHPSHLLGILKWGKKTCRFSDEPHIRKH